MDFLRLASDTTLFHDKAVNANIPAGADGLRARALLLREINLERQEKLNERQVFLLVINIADTKRYDDIIRVFGYKFADDLLSIRIADLDFVNGRQPAYRVGFWSVGLIFHAFSRQDYESSLARLIAALAKPVICRGIPVPIKAGVGVCDLMKGLGSAEDLLQATFLAGQVGASSPAGWAECNYDLSDDHRRAFSLISHAGYSLTKPNEFELTYQARIILASGRCNAAEALLRWHHPTLGTVMPDEFVPLIEMTGLVRELTFWVLSRAIAQAALWQAEGHNLKIAVNISPKNLEEPDFVARLAELLDVHRLPARFLELEFSESRSFTNADDARERLRDLRALGVSISIDDFGIGANGFLSLEHIPANVVKIDRHLVQSMADNARQRALVKSMIAMAHELDMAVVAEGVDSQRTLQILRAWDCDYAEGFLINKPMAAEPFIAWYSRVFKPE